MAKAAKKVRKADYATAEGQKRLMAESVGLPSDTYVTKHLDVSKPGDYGSDPLGDGKHRMVPSGDIVDNAERSRRMDLYKAGTPYVSPTAQVPEQVAKERTEQVSSAPKGDTVAKAAKTPKPLTPAQYVKAERAAGRFPSMAIKQDTFGKF